MNIKNIKMIDCGEWDKLVQDTYGRIYCFQQQDGCKDRGIERFTVPDEDNEENMHDSVPEVVNHPTMGVKFSSWLSRDPKTPIDGQRSDYQLVMWWERNFYPDIQAVANDLHKKGLLEAGEYTINIDW